MLVKVLSDHGGEQLEASGRQWEEAAADHAAWQAYYAQASAELWQARRAKAWWRRMLGVSSEQERAATERTDDAAQRAASAESAAQEAHRRIQQQSAGAYGEELLAWALSGLSDEWILLRGYRNRRGETDSVLVGPCGVWAIEVKRRRVQLHAVGDQWWYSRLSSRGQIYESQLAVDSAGRSWPRQVGDVAEDLQTWLRRNRQSVTVNTAVMLMHEQAQLVECASPAVDFVGTDPARLIDAMMASPAAPLSPNACADIVRLVERDHSFHARRRLSRDDHRA